MELSNLSQMTQAQIDAALPGDTAALRQMVREYGEHVDRPIPGIECRNGGMCWSYPRLKLRGYRTRRQLLNAMKKKGWTP